MWFKKAVISFVVGVGLVCMAYGQEKRVGGFYPAWIPGAVNDVHYSCLTDLYYAFFDPVAGGGVTEHSPATLNALVAEAHNTTNHPYVRVHISFGGASQGSTGWSDIAGNPASINTFAQNVANVVQNYDLDGVSLDWEFPAGFQAGGYANIAVAVRNELDALEPVMGRTLYLSGAVSPLQWNNDGINATFINVVDYLHLMTFDDGGCGPCEGPNHSSLGHAENSIQYWTGTKGAPASKLNIAIPFYDNGGQDYNNFSNADPPGFFNNTDPNGLYMGHYYNSCPYIESKVDMALGTYDIMGIWTWEVSKDRTDQYNLTCCMWDKMEPYMDLCNVPVPDLGDDLSLCGSGGSVLLNSQVGTAGGRTFVWRRNGAIIGGASDPTYTATQEGTYRVEVTEDGCTETDEVVVSASLAVPDLGSDRHICQPAFYDLAPLNPGSFPAGTEWKWSRDGADISGATDPSLDFVRLAGTYRLTADIADCDETFGEVTITSDLPDPVDGCRDDPGTLNIGIANAPGSSYEWYDAPTGGSLVGTGTAFTTPSLAATVIYYVEDADAGAPMSAFTTGPSGTPAPSTHQFDGHLDRMYFDVTTDLTINSVTIFRGSWQGTFAGNIEIQTSGGVTVGTPVAFSIPDGAGFEPLEVTLDIAVPAGTGYQMLVTGWSSGRPGYKTWAGPYTSPGGEISITSADANRMNFFDWEVTAGSATCDRLPVVAQIGDCIVPAPVELVAFSGTYNRPVVDLEWTTVTEENNDFFVIERSQDGANFPAIGTVPGNGNAEGLIHYTFTDAHPKPGTNYYRLAQQDFDGTVNHSQVIAVHRSEVTITVAPNPFSDATTVHIGQADGEDFRVTVTDARGVVYQEQQVSGNTSMRIGDGFPAGFYIVRISNGSDQTRFVKIIKR